jgi:tRNA pseudouridine38-40 synthase
MRWRIQLSYLGTHYCGWQRQNNGPSVQQTLEEAFGLILQQPIEIVGCGRTDADVHARQYVAHLDVLDVSITEKVFYQINAVLPHDISIHQIDSVDSNFHARFDAIDRQYKYYIHFEKNPFKNDQSFFFNQHVKLNQEMMHKEAALLLHYQEFQPFCKTGSDADHFKCALTTSAWSFEKNHAIYTITSNRFLRGMVRLIVGAGLNIGLGKMSIADLRNCLENQSSLPYAWSVPPEGLFLEEVNYKM